MTLKITPVQSPVGAIRESPLLLPFSCFVVSVATDMSDCYENNPHPISRWGDSRIAPTIVMIGGVGGNRHERLL